MPKDTHVWEFALEDSATRCERGFVVASDACRVASVFRVLAADVPLSPPIAQLVGCFCRHRVEFTHNTFTGKRLLKLDGKQIHKVTAKYKLTGTIKFKINNHNVSVSIDPSGVGGLNCTGLVNTTGFALLLTARLSCTCVCVVPGQIHSCWTRRLCLTLPANTPTHTNAKSGQWSAAMVYLVTLLSVRVLASINYAWFSDTHVVLAVLRLGLLRQRFVCCLQVAMALCACVTFVLWFLRFEVYIDNVAVACAADFVDVGSAYLFELPSGEPGKITVKPTKRTDRPVVELFVNNTRVGRADGGDDESKK